MTDVVIWVALIFLLVLSLIILTITALWFLSVVGSRAPFVPVPMEAVPGIVDALKLEKDSVVYDMGCGDGRVLFACKEKQPSTTAVGIEKALLPYVLARMNSKAKEVRLLRRNFFREDLREATHVVLYLFPELMQEIEEKFRNELQPGTRVVAIDFAFPGRTPTETIVQHIPGMKRGVSLFVYVF